MAADNVIVLIMKSQLGPRAYKKGQLFMGVNGWEKENGNSVAEAIPTKMILKEFDIELP